MTDFPAVIYIKASPSPSAQGSQLGKEVEVHNKVFKHQSNIERNYKKEKEELKELLLNFDRDVSKRFEEIDQRLDFMSNYSDILDEKLELASKQLNTVRTSAREPRRHAVITLNTEDDYPDGSWLGNPDDVEQRVRCHITPTDMFHIHTTCTTAEKMALTLLDHLFDRETQARSNISGTGKHRKQQLDPLLIYGLKCHLRFHFGTTDQEWCRIKQNMDSKCRTAFRRKMKGLPLFNKGTFRSLQSDQFETDLGDSDGFLEDLTADDITFRVVESEGEYQMLEGLTGNKQIAFQLS